MSQPKVLKPMMFLFRENAHGCSLGQPPEEMEKQSAMDVNDPDHIPAFRLDNSSKYFTPGVEYEDRSGHLRMKVGAGDEFFVTCRDEKVIRDVLRVDPRRIVRGAKDTRMEGKVLGFYGLQYVMIDVTDKYKEAFGTVTNRLSTLKSQAELQERATAATTRASAAEQRAADLEAQLKALKDEVSKKTEPRRSGHAS